MYLAFNLTSKKNVSESVTERPPNLISEMPWANKWDALPAICQSAPGEKYAGAELICLLSQSTVVAKSQMKLYIIHPYTNPTHHRKHLAIVDLQKKIILYDL